MRVVGGRGSGSSAAGGCVGTGAWARGASLGCAGYQQGGQRRQQQAQVRASHLLVQRARGHAEGGGGLDGALEPRRLHHLRSRGQAGGPCKCMLDDGKAKCGVGPVHALHTHKLATTHQQPASEPGQFRQRRRGASSRAHRSAPTLMLTSSSLWTSSSTSSCCMSSSADGTGKLVSPCCLGGGAPRAGPLLMARRRCGRRLVWVGLWRAGQYVRQMGAPCGMPFAQ